MLRRHLFQWDTSRLFARTKYAAALVMPRRARWAQAAAQRAIVPPATAAAAPGTEGATRLLLIRPDYFAVNEAAVKTNAFMHRPFLECPKARQEAAEMRERALREHADLAGTLHDHGFETYVVSGIPDAPDAVFCNNPVSVHHAWETADGQSRIVLYPMSLPNRRIEIREEINDLLRAVNPTAKIVDLRGAFACMYLEGTGSLVLDRAHRVAFAALSPRTYLMKVRQFATSMAYTPIIFHAHLNGTPVYHTNVVVALGRKWCVVALECIAQAEHPAILKHAEITGRQVIDITAFQVKKYCANILEITNARGQTYTLMSTGARDAFTADQLAALEPVIAVDLKTIEKYGGGSARCCVCEI